MIIKKMSKALLFSALSLSLIACGNSDSDSGTDTVDSGGGAGSTGEQITLRMAWWGSQARHDGTVKVIELYESQNENVDIQYEFFDFDGYFTKLNTLVASDSVWDVFQLGGNYPSYIDNIHMLNDFIDDGTIDVSDTTEQYLNTTNADGDQVGISLGVNSYGIAYDPQMFADAGVEEPADNWTWEDFEAAAKQSTPNSESLVHQLWMIS